MKKKPLVNTAIRLDREKVKQAQKIGVDIAYLFRETLDKALLAGGRCPMCKQRLFKTEDHENN
jgi:hypothetical protein